MRPEPGESDLMTPTGGLRLRRHPPDPRELQRAWDAADAYLLDHLGGGAEVEAASGLPGGVDLSGTVLLLEDRWGALATALAGCAPVSVTDSAVARAAARANLERNGRGGVVLASSLDPLPERVDVVVVRLPKALALLEHRLHRVRERLHAGSVVVAAGMVAEVHTSTVRLFEELVGPTRTSRARRKARLLVSRPDPERVVPADPWPQVFALADAPGPLAGVRVVQHAGVFSAGRLDVGTRAFVDALLQRRGFAAGEHVLDLGCGNGVVGLAALLVQPRARVTFVDDSDLAVASARATVGANVPGAVGARFLVGDSALAATSGQELEPGSVDVVLCNPPFHVHRSVTAGTASRMFRDARRVLRPGGELWVVGNRHLGHHVSLRRLFGGCEVVASDPRFVVLRAVRR